MSQQYDDTNRGALFKNTQRATDRQPEYKGAINVGGTDYWISAWIKTSKAGDRYMSLSVTAKDVPAAKPPPAPRTPGADDMDDIPF
jgi:uncharacterized protein (DUF736 family)